MHFSFFFFVFWQNCFVLTMCVQVQLELLHMQLHRQCVCIGFAIISYYKRPLILYVYQLFFKIHVYNTSPLIAFVEFIISAL